MGRWGGRDSASAGERDGEVTPDDRTRYQDLRLRLAKSGLTREEQQEYERLHDKVSRLETGSKHEEHAADPEKAKGVPGWHKDTPGG